MWDPGQYLRYAGERGRPFFDLVARVGRTIPASWRTSAAGRGT